MNWLGIEASTRDISLAFLSGSVEVEHRVGPATALTASEAIPRLLAGLQSRVGWRMTDLSAVAVSRGPGSFTGIRMGLAAARAFGMALGIPVVGVSTLEGLAGAAVGLGVTGHARQKLALRRARLGLSSRADGPYTPSPHGRLVTVLDALRGEVYVAAYRVRDERLTQTLPPSRCPVDRLRKLGPAAWVAGDDESARALAEAGFSPVGRVRPSALAVARLARRAGARRGVPAPRYLREPESVVRWKQQQPR